MKLLIVTCIKEYMDSVSTVFGQAGIVVYSTTNVTGRKQGMETNLLEDWFASGSEDIDSVMMFAFTNDINADRGMELINAHNNKAGGEFPVRAFIVPVEKSI